MTLTLVVWLALFGILAVAAFLRPVWGVVLYMLTFFLHPAFWWWGKPIAAYRWNLYAGIIMAVSIVLANASTTIVARPRIRKWMDSIAIALLINATLVHVLLAEYWHISSEPWSLLAKFVLLYFMIIAACRTPEDFRIILLSIILGAAYIGYRCTLDDMGRLSSGRLEGVGAPAADGANQLASLMVTILPLTGAFFLAGRPWQKLLMLPIAPLILNVILLCNSRGAFLSLFATVGSLVFFVPKAMRTRILKLLAAGGVATWLLLGDPQIVQRFMTTFSSPEERDGSAGNRLIYWTAGLRMVSNYPLGAGGFGFKKVHGRQYLTEVTGRNFAKAVHNGFINEACEWGVQGVALRMGFMLGALLILWQNARLPVLPDDLFGRILGCCIFGAITGFLITSIFGDYLDSEWGYWMAALAVAHARFVEVGVRLGDASVGVRESPAWATAYPQYPAPARANAPT